MDEETVLFTSDKSIDEIKEMIVRFEQLSNRHQYSEWQIIFDQLVARGAEPFLKLLATVSEGREDRPIRWAIALILGRTRDSRAVEALCRLLKDEYSSVQSTTAIALYELADPHSVEALLEALRMEKDPKTLRYVALTLARIGDVRAVKPLTRICEQVATTHWGGYQTPRVLADAVSELRRKTGQAA